MTKPIIVFCDRDGNLIKDRDNFLGTDPNWREQIQPLPGTIEGVKIFNSIPGIYVVIVTNQAGVALTGIDPETEMNFDNLTEDVAYEVNKSVVEIFGRKGAHINGFVTCPFVDKTYVEKSRQRGRTVDERFVVEEGHRDMKPNIGMLETAAQNLGYRLEQCIVHVLGDRSSDVQMGLNVHHQLSIESFSVLVPGWKTRQRDDIPKVEKLAQEHPDRVYIAKDFLDAVEYVARHISRLS